MSERNDSCVQWRALEERLHSAYELMVEKAAKCTQARRELRDAQERVDDAIDAQQAFRRSGLDYVLTEEGVSNE